MYAQGQMRKDRRLKLEAIDFIWDQGPASQPKESGMLLTFEEKGHIREEERCGMELWRWTKKMI
jgi:hypothetical protein